MPGTVHRSGSGGPVVQPPRLGEGRHGVDGDAVALSPDGVVDVLRGVHGRVRDGGGRRHEQANARVASTSRWYGLCGSVGVPAETLRPGAAGERVLGGQCMVHRAELMTIHGAWTEAWEGPAPLAVSA